MSVLRLDKIICDCGQHTRSEARQLIKSGCVKVDGKTVTAPDTKLDGSEATISISGKPIRLGRERYYMLNKPDGVLSATEDVQQKTVLDLFPSELSACGLFPVGRLDKDTTGLLLITNDGEFSHRITSPKHHIQKTYETYVDGILTDDDVVAFEKGIVLRDETHCLPAALSIDENDRSHAKVTVFEGKYHQIKRMLAAVGKPVSRLKRISIGGLMLDDSLKPGEFRELTLEEKNSLFI